MKGDDKQNRHEQNNHRHGHYLGSVREACVRIGLVKQDRNAGWSCNAQEQGNFVCGKQAYDDDEEDVFGIEFFATLVEFVFVVFMAFVAEREF